MSAYLGLITFGFVMPMSGLELKISKSPRVLQNYNSFNVKRHFRCIG